MILVDYPNGPNVITRVPKSRRSNFRTVERGQERRVTPELQKGIQSC